MEISNIKDPSLLLNKDFRWRDGRGNFHSVAKMSTAHLFNSLRMIWNNFMPDPVPDDPKFYNFGSFYTDLYFCESVINIGNELNLRDDLSEEMNSQIDWMKAKMKSYGEKNVGNYLKFFLTN